MSEQNLQGNDEWLQARLGKVTASRFADVLSKLRNGTESASRKKYKVELVLERLTGESTDSYSNQSMDWGVEQEPYAKIAYMEKYQKPITEYGFVEHKSIKDVGCSPDGGIDKSGGVEIKCPDTTTHIETILGQKTPSKYMAQMQGQMWVMDWEYIDFVSFDPRLPDYLQLFVKRVERDDKYIRNLETEVVLFKAEVLLLEQQLKDHKEL